MDTPRLSLIALGLVVLAHLWALGALSSLRIASVKMPTTAMFVEVIRTIPDVQQTPDIDPPKPATTLPKPKPVSRREHPQPAVETPVLATESPAPAPSSEVEKIAQPVVLPSVQAPVQPTASASVSQTMPRFDADYLDNPAPVYPPLSRRAGEEGKVVLRVFVEPNGLPSRVEVRSSSGFERLDKSAATAVGRWKFIPARQGDDVVGAWVLVPIAFSLKV